MERPESRAPLAARCSAVAVELEQRERQAAVVAALYLCGLVASPLVAIALVIKMLGNLLGLPLIALMVAALTQKHASRPVAAGEKDGDRDDGFAPLHRLGPALSALLERMASRVGAPVPAVVFL